MSSILDNMNRRRDATVTSRRNSRRSVREGRAVAARRARGSTGPGGQTEATPAQGGGFHLRALKRAWRQFNEGSLSHWTTTTVIALSLTIYGSFALLLANANSSLERWKGDNLITVFMEAGASVHQLAAVKEMIAGRNVTGLAIVTPAEAMGRMKSMLGGEAGLLDDLEENPLPTSIEFKLAKGRYMLAEQLAHEIGTWPGVEAVSYDHQWAKRLEEVVRAMRYTGLVLSFMLLTAVALIISNTIKLTIIARRDEVEVMRFMGATDAFIKTPFIYEGVLQGFLGSVGAFLFTFLLYVGARETTVDLGRSFGIHLQLHYLPVSQQLVILALGITLGLVGALISLSRFLEV